MRVATRTTTKCTTWKRFDRFAANLNNIAQNKYRILKETARCQPFPLRRSVRTITTIRTLARDDCTILQTRKWNNIGSIHWIIELPSMTPNIHAGVSIIFYFSRPCPSIVAETSSNRRRNWEKKNWWNDKCCKVHDIANDFTCWTKWNVIMCSKIHRHTICDLKSMSTSANCIFRYYIIVSFHEMGTTRSRERERTTFNTLR